MFREENSRFLQPRDKLRRHFSFWTRAAKKYFSIFSTPTTLSLHGSMTECYRVLQYKAVKFSDLFQHSEDLRLSCACILSNYYPIYQHKPYPCTQKVFSQDITNFVRTEYFQLEGTCNDHLVQLPVKLVLVQLNMSKGRKNALKKQYINCIENNSYLYRLKAVRISGGCLKHCKKLACGSLKLSFPPVAFLYCAKQSSGPAEAPAHSSEDYKCTTSCWCQLQTKWELVPAPAQPLCPCLNVH